MREGVTTREFVVEDYDGAIALWSNQMPPPSERIEGGVRLLVQRRRIVRITGSLAPGAALAGFQTLR